MNRRSVLRWVGACVATVGLAVPGVLPGSPARAQVPAAQVPNVVMALSASPAIVRVGSTVTITASRLPARTGFVDFYVDSIPVGTVAVGTTGTATLRSKLYHRPASGGVSISARWGVFVAGAETSSTAQTAVAFDGTPATTVLKTSLSAHTAADGALVVDLATAPGPSPLPVTVFPRVTIRRLDGTVVLDSPNVVLMGDPITGRLSPSLVVAGTYLVDIAFAGAQGHNNDMSVILLPSSLRTRWTVAAPSSYSIVGVVPDELVCRILAMRVSVVGPLSDPYDVLVDGSPVSSGVVNGGASAPFTSPSVVGVHRLDIVVGGIVVAGQSFATSAPPASGELVIAPSPYIPFARGVISPTVGQSVAVGMLDTRAGSTFVFLADGVELGRATGSCGSTAGGAVGFAMISAMFLRPGPVQLDVRDGQSGTLVTSATIQVRP